MKNSFKSLSFPELKAKRDELNRKYMDFRFQMVIGHVDNPLQKRVLRRQIARLNTLIGQQELARQSESAEAKSRQEPARQQEAAQAKA